MALFLPKSKGLGRLLVCSRSLTSFTLLTRRSLFTSLSLPPSRQSRLLPSTRLYSTDPDPDKNQNDKQQQKTTMQSFNDVITSKHTRQKVFAETKARSASAMKNAIDKLPKPNRAVFRENIYTLPNILTFTRLVAAPVVGILVLRSNHVAATAVFLYACVTDWLDGHIARKYGLQSVVGSVIDPMADKMLMVTLTGCLAWIGSLPLWIAIIIFGRDALLGISAIYYRYISLPPPKTMARYWDFSIPSAEVHPTTISKYNTFLQMGLLATTLVKPFAFQQLSAHAQVLASQAIVGLEYTVAVTTILSGLSYVFSKTAVKILTEEEIEKRRIEQEKKNTPPPPTHDANQK